MPGLRFSVTVLLFISGVAACYCQHNDLFYLAEIEAPSPQLPSRDDPSQCADYDWGSKDFCECVVGRSDNFFCNYDCTCNSIICESSKCSTSWQLYRLNLVSTNILLQIPHGKRLP